MKRKLLSIARAVLPITTRRRLTRITRWPPVGLVRYGNLRRLRPISTEWGSERGKPVDRYYIEAFLANNQKDIGGRVLEIGTNKYTKQFGAEKVTRSDVLHATERQPDVTIHGDLTVSDVLPADSFDCVILTQTLQFIYDVPSALHTVHRALKPGGVLLATFPGISPIGRYEMEMWGHYWAFTTLSARRLLEAEFSPGSVQVEARGNVLAAIAFLHGLACEELRRHELEYHDDDFELLITVRAVKDGATA